MPNNCYRCSRCGRCRNCGRPMGPAGALADAPAAGGCVPPDNLPRELYDGRSAAEAQCATCYDPLYGCQQYDLRSRNPYWPGFCHPRWLLCQDLYRGGRGRL